MSKREIPPLRLAFIKHLLADPEMCATRAYKAAGYKVKNDSVAAVEGMKLLRIPYIKEAIEKEKEKRAKRLDASVDKTLLKLMRGQEFDVRKLYKLHPAEPGRMILKMPWELCDEAAAAVVGVKYKDGLLEEYKIIDVLGCTKLVGNHMGMFTDKIDISGSIDLATRIINARKRSNKTD